jgi:hypothetical protein
VQTEARPRGRWLDSHGSSSPKIDALTSLARMAARARLLHNLANPLRRAGL